MFSTVGFWATVRETASILTGQESTPMSLFLVLLPLIDYREMSQHFRGWVTEVGEIALKKEIE